MRLTKKRLNRKFKRRGGDSNDYSALPNSDASDDDIASTSEASDDDIASYIRTLFIIDELKYLIGNKKLDDLIKNVNDKIRKLDNKCKQYGLVLEDDFYTEKKYVPKTDDEKNSCNMAKINLTRRLKKLNKRRGRELVNRVKSLTDAFTYSSNEEFN